MPRDTRKALMLAVRLGTAGRASSSQDRDRAAIARDLSVAPAWFVRQS
jgi:hypothetical protein